MSTGLSRRQFARQSAAWIAAAASGAALSSLSGCTRIPARSSGAALPVKRINRAGQPRSFRFAMLDAAGKPMGEWQRKSLYAADLHFEPERRKSALQPDGTIEITATIPACSFHAKIPVAGFGDVWVIADNEGEGYGAAKNGVLDFVAEAARSRRADVARFLKSHPQVPFSQECRQRFQAAEDALAQAARAAGSDAARLHMEALSHGLWAGELAVVEQARHAIANMKSRRDFLFGCNTFQYKPGTPYAELFPQVMNYGTLPFYLASLERIEGQPNYDRVETILAWCEKIGIRPKGHPLWWGHEAGIPRWLAGADWPDARRHCIRVVGRSVERYRGRIDWWDVINEAHDWANGLNLTQDQEIEITRICCDTARAKNDKALVVVNNCCPFGEYAAEGRVHKGPVFERVFTPLAYLERLIESGVEFDVVGVQIYFPARDMMAIGKLLDEYQRFGKPVHVTELGVRSDPGRGGVEWHGPFSEKIQADWMEWFYTLAYPRQPIKAITWWDFAEPAFIRSGAFLDENQRPREIFHRLKALQKSWGLAS